MLWRTCALEGVSAKQQYNLKVASHCPVLMACRIHPHTHTPAHTHTHTHTHTNAQGRRSLGPECIAKHRTIEGDQRNSLRKRGNYSIVMGRRDDRDDPAPAPAPAPAPVPPLAAFSLSCAASTLANMPLPKYEATVEKPSLLRSSYMSSKGSHW